jgi:hypothetical protein
LLEEPALLSSRLAIGSPLPPPSCAEVSSELEAGGEGLGVRGTRLAPLSPNPSPPALQVWRGALVLQSGGRGEQALPADNNVASPRKPDFAYSEPTQKAASRPLPWYRAGRHGKIGAGAMLTRPFDDFALRCTPSGPRKHASPFDRPQKTTAAANATGGRVL